MRVRLTVRYRTLKGRARQVLFVARSHGDQVQPRRFIILLRSLDLRKPNAHKIAEANAISASTLNAGNERLMLLRRLLDYFERALRKERRLSVEEFYQLLHLAETITDYGRMMQAYHRVPVPTVTLEVSELANRFRETPRRIKSALLLLKDMRRAHPTRLSGCWELQLVEDKRDDVPSSDGASLRQVG
jgi:hypothetical protein